MQQTVHVIFDGEVLRPEEPLRLQPHARYQVTIEEAPERAPATENDLPLLRSRRISASRTSLPSTIATYTKRQMPDPIATAR